MILKDFKWVEIVEDESQITRNSALYLIPTVTDSFRILIRDDNGEDREFIPLSSNDINYVHEQILPELIWVIPHNLGKYPSVTLLDELGNEFESDVRQPNSSLLEVHNNIPISGKAVLN